MEMIVNVLVVYGMENGKLEPLLNVQKKKKTWWSRIMKREKIQQRWVTARTQTKQNTCLERSHALNEKSINEKTY